MGIIELQRRIAEVGRIRIGQQVSGKGGKRPAKLSTFRLTSADRTRIFNAAKLFGGQPGEWDAPAGPQWEVITEAASLNVIVPPSDMCFSQNYELWSGGGCQRRCDGVAATYNEDGNLIEGGCLCDPDKRECALHTRLSVMLRDLPGLGVWRIDSSGYYAAVELQGAVDVIQMAAGRGQMLPARLLLEQRMTKRPGQGTRRFAVPVLDVEVTPGQLLGSAPIGVDATSATLAIEPPPRPLNGSTAPAPPPRAFTDGGMVTPPPPPRALTPVSETVPVRPTASIADQANAEVKSRKRASTPRVPSTGLAPRPAAEFKSGAGLTAGKTGERAAGTGMPAPAPPPPEPPPDEEQIPLPEPPPQEDQIPLPEEPAVEPPQPPTAAMTRKMHALFRDLDLHDRDDRLHVTSYILGRQIKSSNETNMADGLKLIDRLQDWAAGNNLDEGMASAADQIREVLNQATLGADQAEDAESVRG